MDSKRIDEFDAPILTRYQDNNDRYMFRKIGYKLLDLLEKKFKKTEQCVEKSYTEPSTLKTVAFTAPIVAVGTYGITKLLQKPETINIKDLVDNHNTFVTEAEKFINAAIDVYKKQFSEIVPEYNKLEHTKIPLIDNITNYDVPADINTLNLINKISKNIITIMDKYRIVTSLVPKFK